MDPDSELSELAEMAGFVFSKLIEFHFDGAYSAAVVAFRNLGGIRAWRFGSAGAAHAQLRANPERAPYGVMGTASADDHGDGRFVATCVRYVEPRLDFALALPFRLGDSATERSIGPGIELLTGLDEEHFVPLGRSIAVGAHGSPRGAALWESYQPRC
jgi:hypothetical protein